MASDYNNDHSYGKWMIVIAWIIALAMLSWFFYGWLEEKVNPNQEVTIITDNLQEKVISLQRNPQGHYLITGTINSHKVDFFLDTGATVVSIPEQLAKKLKLKKGHAKIARTANGDITVYRTIIDKLTLGPIVLHNVEGAITPGISDNYVLLGMSALTRLEFTQRGNQLIIKQYESQH